MNPSGNAQLPVHYLKPGEIHLTSTPAMVTTILGSCLCVTMYHKYTRLAAICHAVMPSANSLSRKYDDHRDIFQYVDSSVEWMVQQFEIKGIKRHDIEVKMFGGAEMFTDGTAGSSPVSVGKKNIDVALRTIEMNRLKLTAWNIGGKKGRKVIFNTLTGEVFAKYVNRTDNTMTLVDYGREK